MQIELHDTYGVLRIKTSEFLFDLEDLPLIKGRDSWYCDKDGYLVSSYFYNGIRRFVRFHRLVMHAKPGQCVDHINKNKADNRKKNLRCCERSENDRNRSLYSCNTSGVAGVYFDKERKKWVASITYNHKKVYLGRYAVKEEAILARLTKEVELYKEFSPQRGLFGISKSIGGKREGNLQVSIGDYSRTGNQYPDAVLSMTALQDATNKFFMWMFKT